MSDDDKTTTDDQTSDTADETTTEPVAEEEAKDETKEKPVEPATSEEPTAGEVTTDAPAAESAGTDQQGRTLYNVKCSNCGKDTQVPFRPSGDRPVYCRDCYMQKKNSQG